MKNHESGVVNVVLGIQRGDEGKGKFVDLLAPEHDIVARFNGGANAGHTIFVNGQEINFHQLPSGILAPNVFNVIGNGCLVDLVGLSNEIQLLGRAGIRVDQKRLAISDAAHLVLPTHIFQDQRREAGEKSQGSTQRGLSFAASDKFLRTGIRVGEIRKPYDLASALFSRLEEQGLTHEYFGYPKLKAESDHEALYNVARGYAEIIRAEFGYTLGYVTDTVDLIHTRLGEGKNVLAEGAQATLLDIDHGTYPDVTSSNTSIGGALTGLGVNASQIGRVYGVAKAPKSYVGGNGPFPTEFSDEAVAEKFRGETGDVDEERGKTTKRPRRLGDLDLVDIRSAVRLNGITDLAATKLDKLGEVSHELGRPIRIATHYLINGAEVRFSPNNARDMARAIPVYEEFPTWKDSIRGVTDYSALPAEAQNVIDFIAENTGVNVTFIGTGPGREELIDRR